MSFWWLLGVMASRAPQACNGHESMCCNQCGCAEIDVGLKASRRHGRSCSKQTCPSEVWGTRPAHVNQNFTESFESNQHGHVYGPRISLQWIQKTEQVQRNITKHLSLQWHMSHMWNLIPARRVLATCMYMANVCGACWAYSRET